MSELLRRAGDVKDALCLAVLGVTMGARIRLDRIATLRDRRDRCRNLPCIDEPLSRLLGAVDLWLVQVDQWRRTGAAQQRGGALVPPSSARDPLVAALDVYCREVNPSLNTRSRRQANAEREAEALEYLNARSRDG